ncbi:MAG: hypothetical protein ABFD86_08790, partial [Bryobacteraceae bacterium]
PLIRESTLKCVGAVLLVNREPDDARVVGLDKPTLDGSLHPGRAGRAVPAHDVPLSQKYIIDAGVFVAFEIHDGMIDPPLHVGSETVVVGMFVGTHQDAAYHNLTNG